MRARFLKWFGVSLLIGVAVLLLWPREDRPITGPKDSPTAQIQTPAPVAVASRVTTNEATVSIVPESTAPAFLTGKTTVAAETNEFTHRLTNTPKEIGELLRDDRAILLENALIDTGRPLGFNIPESLQSPAEPGSYIVQSRGVINDSFRAALATAGATIVSYIPNNAYLVTASAEAAVRLAANPQTQAVLPYEPIYKLKSELLGLAVEQKPLPAGANLNLMLFAGLHASAREALEQSGVVVLNEASSPFGPVVTVRPGSDWSSLARLPGVQVMELARVRVRANDLSRVRLGVATDSVTQTNYLGLTGTNVIVSLNDTGVSTNHPDLVNRVFPVTPGAGVDNSGHGTHVAGIIAGDGTQSITVTNARGSINPGTNFQYRGKAPGAKLFVQSLDLGFGPVSDATLQANSARTNSLISNNSWHYASDNSYSIASSAYDAAARDALPGVPGSQPQLFVFSAGNAGGGDNDGLGGSARTIQSPGTAKNGITVGAIELLRDVTNIVTKMTSTSTNTSTPWKNSTSSDSQVAGFSSRGNVAIGIEGQFGRFKPDVVAPGTFVISTRSTTWDEAEYYNPTSHIVVVERRSVATNSFDYPLGGVFVPENAVGFTIRIAANDDSPDPFPRLPIYVKKDDYPTLQVFDFIRTNNFVSVPPDGGGLGANVGQSWYYGIRNNTTQAISFTLITDVTVTNDLGDYLVVLSNLNNSISGATPHHYRYESGTSMAAADVSGTLALMQEFFEQKLGLTNSPALMKALLINGARSVDPIYNFRVKNTKNFQGWGLPNLANSIPGPLTNGVNLATNNSILLFDQSPTNALATGQQKTRLISVDEAGRTLPLRISLVWTDPPGNPAAGIKLVNDLDLVVTNLDNPANPIVYYGNDIPSGLVTFASSTNAPPNPDVVNNVENVYLDATLGTNYSVTVLARRVNVNAVTAHTNDFVQDYALVIASGNGEATNALKLVDQLPIQGTNSDMAAVTVITNLFTASTFSSASLVGQRVGANTPLLPLLGSTNGITNQWHFYVITNSTTYTNASFLVSAATDLSIPRIGVFEPTYLAATRESADVDLYVAPNNPDLLRLYPAVIAAADKSLSRNTQNGDESVIYSNSVSGDVYYIGVKSEDFQAAEFEFWAVFSLLPLGQEDADGFIPAFPFNPPEGFIPDGPTDMPGVAKWRAFVPAGGEVRRVIVTNSLIHQNLPDLVGTLVSPNRRAVTFLNHANLLVPPKPGPYNFLYEDSDEGDIVGAIHPDGPGRFQDYVGENRGGQWNFFFVDNALSATGRVNQCRIKIERQPENGQSITNVVLPNSWKYYSRNVPVNATNLTVCIQVISTINPQPLQLYIRKDRRPTTTAFDFTRAINLTGCLTVDRFSLPPLTPGRYFIGVFNPNTSSQTFVYRATVEVGPDPTSIPFDGVGSLPLLDDAVTNYTTLVTNIPPSARIAQLEVGLRLDHPRVSDLAVTLISPRGTRVLLVENRGGTDPNGFGSSLSVTNFTPVDADGGQAGQTNFIPTGSTGGSVTIDYNFQNEPDQMTVYYEGVLLYDTGMIGGTGRLNLNYGPGTSTQVEIRMNEFTNSSTSTLWSYTVSSYNTANSYLIFTENTNKTTTPVKFALPPFVGAGGTNYNVSLFDPPVTPGNYPPGLVDGWSVLTTNTVTVITNTADTLPQSLSLGSGQLMRSLPTTPGRNYRLNFAYRKATHLDGLISWWPAEGGAAVDIVSGFNGTNVGGVTFPMGFVGQAFGLNGTNAYVDVPHNDALNPTTAITVDAWIRRAGALYAAPIIKKSDPSQSFGYALEMENTGTAVRFGVYLNGTGWVLTPSFPVPVGVWTHVAAVFDGATVSLYVDGLFRGSAPAVGTITPSPANLRIGNDPSNPTTRFFPGDIDEPAVWGRALTAAEILGIYTDGAEGKCAGLPLLINLDFGAGPLTGPSPKIGRAAVGQAVNDFWNFYSRGDAVWRDDGSVANLKLANGLGTQVGLTVLNARGAWGNGSLDQMYNSYLYPLPNGPGLVTMTVTNLPVGMYDFYVYSHNGNYQLTSGAVNYGTKTTLDPIPGGTPVWQQGIQYALYQGVVVTNSAQPVTIVASPGIADVAMIAGIQIMGASIFPPPAVCDPLGAQIFVSGRVTNSFIGTTNWQPAGLVFTATNTTTDVYLSPMLSNAPSGVLVDSFTLVESSSPRYVLPEESLKVLDGEFAYGEWKLEVWDSRTGATNTASLVSWQLQFLFQTNTAVARPLNPGDPVTTTIPANSIAIYTVDVPFVARFATNILFGATPGPLGFYFNQYTPPVFGATNPAPFPDTVFTASATNWTELLNTTNTVPLLLPGERYYLAVENKNAFPVSYTVMVDFDLSAFPPFVTLTNGIEYCAFNAGPSVSLDYYRYIVSSNALRAQFEIINPSGDMTLLLRKDLPPAFGNFDYLSANPFTNSEVITVFDFSQPVALTPGDWYMAAANISGGPVTYCVKAIEWPVYGTNIVITNVFLGTNSFCLTWTSLPGVHYVVEGLTDLTSTNWVTASPTITATGPLTTYCVPLPSPLQFFRVREGIALNLYTPPPVISRIRRVFNGIDLTWGGPTNAQYQVQWTPTLVPTNWTAFTNPPAVTSATGLFQFLDDGSETGGFNGMRFYRLLVLP